MSKLTNILNQPEGRRLELKETLPTNAVLVKTIVSFANDAGGEFYLGIKDNPREVIGVDEDQMIELEERISNIIPRPLRPGYSARHFIPQTRRQTHYCYSYPQGE